MQSYLLGVDIGTGSIKTVAVDLSGKALCSSQRFYDTQSPQPGYSEQNVQDILQAFIQSIQDVVLKMKSSPSCISLSSVMHSIMAVDENGEALTHLILWSDARSSAIAKKIKESPQGKTIYEATGTPVHSMSPLCKIIWLKENMPEVFKRAHKFISIKEYIWYQLFQQFEIDHSLASATGLFDIIKLRWYDESLSLAGIAKERLSHPVATSYLRKNIKKEIAAALHIPASTSFCIGASDGCLANLGTSSLQPHIAAITIGTSGALRVTRKKPLIDAAAMSFNYLLDENTFVCGGPINNGGTVVQWLLKNFLSRQSATDHDYEKLFNAIEKVPAGCEGLIFLPYLYGERAPVWDEQSCGVYFGVRSYHRQQHFLRAAIEGVCFALKDILVALEKDALSIVQINASGGFVQSAVWMQMLADITGKHITLQQSEDASAIGAAWLALKALHIIGDYNSLELQPVNIIQPQKKLQDAYQKNYTVFKLLYPNLKATMHLL
ncbi:MAG: gluconokinase [Flavisolibacter sp.]